MRLALDAMGGDFAPAYPIEAAVKWTTKNNIPLVLVGDEERISTELKKYEYQEKYLKIVHAPEAILMTDNMTQALLQKKKSSLRVALSLHKKGEVDGVISPGHSGAMMAISKLLLKPIEGIERPFISTMFPTKDPKRKIVISDAGGNTECTPANLLEFAICSTVYLENLHGIEHPRVALLNIGSEEGKGNKLLRESYELFKKSGLNFVGNIEGKEIFDGKTDILICDGFVGNVVLKSCQGVFSYLMHVLKQEFAKKFYYKLGWVILRPVFKRIYADNNYENYGGALLLGVRGVPVVCHGGSTVKAIQSAISFAKWAVEAEIEKKTTEKIESFRTNMNHE